jgi:steroid 5-alpha reductase family enzyme
MATLLLRFSGVPLLEAELMRRKPGYRDYVRRTSVLIPWPPRS